MNEAEVPGGWLKAPVIAAALFNVVPIVGVLFWGWSAFALIFLYWLENLLIGARTVGSMLATSVFGTVRMAGAVAIAAFFTLHYGLFCFVHGTFVVSMFGGEAYAGDGLFDLFTASQKLFSAEPGLIAGLISIGLWQVVQLVLFVVRGEAKASHPLALMPAPYPRIIILHLTIIFGGFLLMWLNEPLAGLVLLALIKAAFDVAEARGKGLWPDIQRRVEERLRREREIGG